MVLPGLGSLQCPRGWWPWVGEKLSLCQLQAQKFLGESECLACGWAPWLVSKRKTWSLCPQFSSVWSLICVQLFVIPWTAACQASLSITNTWSLLKLVSIELVMPSNHLILCHPLLLLPSIFPSIRVFSNESAIHVRWPKYWSFSFNISPSNKHPGLISFRTDWLDLLVVQGTVKSLLQQCSSKASILRCSAFFIVQLSHHTRLLEKP